MSIDETRLSGVSRLSAPLALAVPLTAAFPLYTEYIDNIDPGLSMSSLGPAILSLLTIALTGGLIAAAVAPNRSAPAVVNAVASFVLYIGTSGLWAAAVGADLTTAG